MQVGFAHEPDFRGVEEAIVVFADEAGVFDGFLGEFAHVGLGADDADVVGRCGLFLVREGDVLADEHADADAGHVEAVEEGLDVGVDLHALPFALVFEDALGCGEGFGKQRSGCSAKGREEDVPTVVTTLSCRRLMPSNVLANLLL